MKTRCKTGCACEGGGGTPRSEGSDRREFLGEMAALAAGLLIALGATRDEAAAAVVSTATGVGAAAEKRYPLPPADGVTIDRDNDVILARYQNKVFAFALACPHENTALRWLAADNRFQCPRHQSRYQPDGTFISGRATRNMDRFAVRKDGNQLLVDLDKLYQSDTNRNEWSAAVAAV